MITTLYPLSASADKGLFISLSTIAALRIYVDSALSGSSYWTLVGSTLSLTDSSWNVTFGDGVDTDLTVGGGAGKIDVGTVDPVYTIGGVRYATYMTGMTGVKEETTGVVNIKCQNSNVKNCENILDFKNAEVGSDLWLFAKTTNLKNNFEKLSVLLTPGFDGNVWYKKDAENLRVFVYGSKSGEVSYRLTAPRFDAEKWTNFSSAEHEGFNLDSLIRE